MKKRLPAVKGTYREGYDLSKVTWFGVGGKAEILYKPSDVHDLCHFLAHKPDDIPVTVIGLASNLLVRDGGIEGVVIRLGRSFTTIEKHGDEIHAGAGSLSSNVARFAQEHGIRDLEFYVGIPGSIGGALAMNAGAYGNDTASILVQAEAVDKDGNLLTLSPEDIGYVYRGNHLPKDTIFTKGVFKGTPDNPEVILKRMQTIMEEREAAQPVRSKTGGSTFKNPQGQSAWKLIDEAGCRGYKVGGAQMSEKHCNFMINTGDATATDLETLGEIIREKVKNQSGIELQWEIKRIGNKK